VTKSIGSDAEQALQVLLVEDNPGDVRLLRELFRKEELTHLVHMSEPLTAIYNFVTILLDKVAGEFNSKQRQYLETVLWEMMESLGKDDIRLTRAAVKDAQVLINWHVASDGIEAMAFLRREGEYANVPRPDLILLDLNLPKKDGREVLEEIKESSTLKTIPVVVLTTSASNADILQSYRLHANGFITKPVDLDGFLKVVKSIDSFWLSEAKLPREACS